VNLELPTSNTVRKSALDGSYVTSLGDRFLSDRFDSLGIPVSGANFWFLHAERLRATDSLSLFETEPL